MWKKYSDNSIYFIFTNRHKVFNKKKLKLDLRLSLKNNIDSQHWRKRALCMDCISIVNHLLLNNAVINYRKLCVNFSENSCICYRGPRSHDLSTAYFKGCRHANTWIGLEAYMGIYTTKQTGPQTKRLPYMSHALPV